MEVKTIKRKQYTGEERHSAVPLFPYAICQMNERTTIEFTGRRAQLFGSME